MDSTVYMSRSTLNNRTMCIDRSMMNVKTHICVNHSNTSVNIYPKDINEYLTLKCSLYLTLIKADLFIDYSTDSFMLQSSMASLCVCVCVCIRHECLFSFSLLSSRLDRSSIVVMLVSARTLSTED
jgi:hypothetical protein